MMSFTEFGERCFLKSLLTSWVQSNSTVGKVFALHVANPGSLSNIPNGPPSITRINF